MKKWAGIWLLTLLLIGIVACNDDQRAGSAPRPTGPALVLFYTDN